MISVPKPAVPAPNARRIAWDVLVEVERSAGWADVLLPRRLARARLEERDLRLAWELVLGVIKSRSFLDYALHPCLRSRRAPDVRVNNLLRLGAYQLLLLSKIPPYAAVNETVAVARQVLAEHHVRFVNAVLRALVRQGAPPLPDRRAAAVAHDALVYSMPEFIVQRWTARWGEENAHRWLMAANEAPPLIARVNRLQGTRPQGLQRLVQAGISAQPDQAPEAIMILPPHGDPATLPGFTEGWWYFQDSASQWVAYVVDPQPGDRILDVCSAPGGKATHLAELLHGHGSVAAFDRHALKLKRVHDNAVRLGLTNLQILDAWPRTELFDRILVDAPCSGLGTLRRHAEARWRIQADDFSRMAKNQVELLRQAGARVKPGGYLIYSTCTTEPEENEEVVQRFIQAQPQFAVVPGPGSQGHPGTDYWDSQGYFRTFPRFPDMDGMFAARLRRSA